MRILPARHGVDRNGPRHSRRTWKKTNGAKRLAHREAGARWGWPVPSDPKIVAVLTWEITRETGFIGYRCPTRILRRGTAHLSSRRPFGNDPGRDGRGPTIGSTGRGCSASPTRSRFADLPPGIRNVAAASGGRPPPERSPDRQAAPRLLHGDRPGELAVRYRPILHSEDALNQQPARAVALEESTAGKVGFQIGHGLTQQREVRSLEYQRGSLVRHLAREFDMGRRRRPVFPGGGRRVSDPPT